MIMSSYRDEPYASYHRSEVTRKANAEFLRMMHDAYSNEEWAVLANVTDHAMLDA
jgi:hypothetical protein